MEEMNEYIACWSSALSELNIIVDEMFLQELGVKTLLGKVPLLKNFGGKNGMVLFPSGTMVLALHQLLLDQGYGYSVIDCPNSPIESYKNDLVLLLKDWSWTGAESEKPEWL